MKHFSTFWEKKYSSGKADVHSHANESAFVYDTNIAIRFIVSGKVQGVYFRSSTKVKALELGLTGRVWNNSDGTVGVIASGDDLSIEALEFWLERGPDQAQVTGVKLLECGPYEFDTFEIDEEADGMPDL